MHLCLNYVFGLYCVIWKLFPLHWNGAQHKTHPVTQICCTYALIEKSSCTASQNECLYKQLKYLTAHTRPTRVCMAPSLSPVSVAFSVKKKYTLSLSLSSLSGMRWAAMNLGSVEEDVGEVNIQHTIKMMMSSSH